MFLNCHCILCFVSPAFICLRHQISLWLLFQFDKNHSYLPGQANLVMHDTDFSQVPQPPKLASMLFIKTHRTFGETIFFLIGYVIALYLRTPNWKTWQRPLVFCSLFSSESKLSQDWWIHPINFCLFCTLHSYFSFFGTWILKLLHWPSTFRALHPMHKNLLAPCIMPGIPSLTFKFPCNLSPSTQFLSPPLFSSRFSPTQ